MFSSPCLVRLALRKPVIVAVLMNVLMPVLITVLVAVVSVWVVRMRMGHWCVAVRVRVRNFHSRVVMWMVLVMRIV